MNTKRSEKKVKAFLKKGNLRERKVQKYEKKFNFSPEKVFFQLCPTRELDWIKGWDCDLVYTTTGYVEKDCIFTTPATNELGSGLWIFSEYEPNEKLGIVRIIENMIVIHLRIRLEDNHDGSCTGKWDLIFTALNEKGDEILKTIPEQNPEYSKAIDGLEYFLETGELME